MSKDKGFIINLFSSNGHITIVPQATYTGLVAEISRMYEEDLADDEAIIFFIMRDCTYVGTRKKGCKDKVLYEFDSYGFDMVFSRLANAIICVIEDLYPAIPQYCIDAILGRSLGKDKNLDQDPRRLQPRRYTTEHLLKVYKKIAKRMESQGKPKKEIELVLNEISKLQEILKIRNYDKLKEKVDMILIEIPKTNAYKRKPKYDEDSSNY